MRSLRRLAPLLASLLLLACRPAPQAPEPPSPPSSRPSLEPQAPAPAPDGPLVAEPQPLTDAERDAVLFAAWRGNNPKLVEPFEEFLAHAKLAHVVPTYQLLRSASMWKECRADPFQVPPPQEWDTVRDVLVLLDELKKRNVISSFEVVSAYRDPKLNRCAGGAPGSSHQRFAVDIAPLPEREGISLCRFWREEGKAWNMGVSRYPSGRIHIDRTGYRTWGASHRRGSSYCLQ